MEMFIWCVFVNKLMNVDSSCCLLPQLRVKEDSPTCGLAPHPSSSAAAKRIAHMFRDLEQHFLHHQGQFAGKMHKLYLCMLA